MEPGLRKALQPLPGGQKAFELEELLNNSPEKSKFKASASVCPEGCQTFIHSVNKCKVILHDDGSVSVLPKGSPGLHFHA